MALDFKDMQDDVLDICQELQGRPDFTIDRVKRMINRGYYGFVKDTDCILDVLSFTTVANQVFYTSSDTANFAYAYKIVSAKYITESSEFGKPLIPYPGGHLNLPRNKGYGEPVYYYTQGVSGTNLKKIGTYPIIDVSSETLEVQVCRFPTTDLSSNTDEPAIHNAYRDALVFYAVWRLYHAYSHLNPAFRAKALEHKNLYRELVDDFKFQNNEEDLGGQQVTDYYAEY